jgi:ABC-type lipoprotein export system ATPase subunit
MNRRRVNVAKVSRGLLRLPICCSVVLLLAMADGQASAWAPILLAFYSIHRFSTTLPRRRFVASSLPCLQDDGHSTTKRIEIQFEPSRIQLHNVSLQYQVTLARKLFSSVPRRKFAVHNVTGEFSSEVVLLQGASSSGKSALMKVMACFDDNHIPASGSVIIDCGETCLDSTAATPIMLIDKPSINYAQNVQARLEKKCHECLPNFIQGTINKNDLVREIVNHFFQITCLEDVILSRNSAQLSPSENYRVRLAEACLESSAPSISNRTKFTFNSTIVLLPAPILLLDEWMDFETRQSSTKVEEAILSVVQSTGAVVFCATHKPNLWKTLAQESDSTTQMTISRGGILKLQQRQKAM